MALHNLNRKGEEGGRRDDELQHTGWTEYSAFFAFAVWRLSIDQNRRRRSEFSTTISELADMPMAAIQGAMKPITASGRAHRL